MVNTQTIPKQEQEASLKLHDEIPFQLSPAYERLWMSGTTTTVQPFKLKDIDWDSLCYDFILEKSILQS